MKKLSSFSPLIAVLVFFSILVFGCKKELSNSLSPQEEQDAATDASMSETDAEFTFNDVFDNVMGVSTEVGIGGAGIFGRMMNNGRVGGVDSTRCFTVTTTPQQVGAFPKTVVIDFGTGCTTQGHTRSGKITIIYTGPLIVPGSSATTTFTNYSIDGLAVQGTHKITNTTNTSSGTSNVQRQFNVDVTDAKITKTNGDYSQWESHRVTTQTDGATSVAAQDDVFKITGSAQGKVKVADKIYAWNSTIKEPLIKKFICPWISKGSLQVIRETLTATSPWVATLDYGNGDCDNKATLTINGNTQQINLH